jgi:hypothetical protein
VLHPPFDTNREAVKLEIKDFPENIAFHPHGIALFNNNEVYVLNHGYSRGGERVEKFTIRSEKNGDN